MVELLPLEIEEDIQEVGDLLREFQTKTGSSIAGEILAEWPGSARKFVKVKTPLYYLLNHLNYTKDSTQKPSVNFCG